MATESPMIHDGAQTIAAANYFNPVSPLSGPGGSGQFLAVIVSTAADRTSLLVSAGGAQIYGILQNKPASGEAADVGIFGVSKAVAGGTVTRGDKLMTDTSARLITWTSGAANAQVGTALESAVVGQIMTAFIGATSPKVLT